MFDLNSVVWNTAVTRASLGRRFAVLASMTVGATSPAAHAANLGTDNFVGGDRSVTAEMNHIDFGNTNMTAADGTVLNTGMRIGEGKIGVNYRF